MKYLDLVRVTAFILVKGGGAKSTFAHIWSTCLQEVVRYFLGDEAKLPEPLLIELDPQGSCSALNGVYDPRLPTMYHVEKGEVTLEDAIVKKGSYGHSPDGVPLPLVDIVPANESTSAINELYLGVKYLQGIKKLREILEMEVPRLPYTHYFIDTPGTQGPIHAAQALAAASDVVIPVLAEKIYIDSMHQTTDLIKSVHAETNPRLVIDGFLATRVQRTTKAEGNVDGLRLIAAEISKTGLPAKAYNATIREKMDIGSSQSEYFAAVTRNLRSMQTHEILAAIAEYLHIFDQAKSQEYLEMMRAQLKPNTTQSKE